jgi:hypothetical protein
VPEPAEPDHRQPDDPQPDDPQRDDPQRDVPQRDVPEREESDRGPAADRPIDPTPIHTAALPATPVRDRTIPATAWIEAPAALLDLGADLGEPVVAYKRRIGPWLLWRAGPPSKGDARYMAVAADDLTARWTFRLFADGTGEGEGPDGVVHRRFRTWKEALRDTAP